MVVVSVISKFLFLFLSNLLPATKTPKGPTPSPINLPLFGYLPLRFEFGPSLSSLEDAVVLFGVDIEGLVLLVEGVHIRTLHLHEWTVLHHLCGGLH